MVFMFCMLKTLMPSSSWMFSVGVFASMWSASPIFSPPEMSTRVFPADSTMRFTRSSSDAATTPEPRLRGDAFFRPRFFSQSRLR